jgi:hypothetical protein
MATHRSGQQTVEQSLEEAVAQPAGRADEEALGPSVFARVVVVASEDSAITRYGYWLAETYETQIFRHGETMSIRSETDVVVVDQQTLNRTKRAPRKIVDLERGDCRVLAPASVDSSDGHVNEYIIKPVSRDRLLSTVETAVRVATYDGTIAELLSLTMQRRRLRDGSDTGQGDRCTDIVSLSERIEELHRRIDNTSSDVESQYATLIGRRRRLSTQKTESENA